MDDNKFRKILVFQTWGIGDMIMSLPMLEALREKQPDAEIAVVAGSNESADIVLGAGVCDRSEVFIPRREGVLGVMNKFFEFRRQSFDLALVCTRLSVNYSRLLRLVSGIKIIAGDSNAPKPWSCSHWSQYDPVSHRIQSNLKILNTLFNVETEDTSPTLKVDEESRQKGEKVWKDLNLNNRSVLGIHPGSGLDQGAVKRFPIAQYKVFISEFLKIYPNARILVFIGPAEATMASIFEEIDNRVLVVMDRSLSVVTALIERLCVMLAGDSGLAHIASAVGTPVVTLAGPTRIEQTKPFGEKNIVIKTKEKLDCMPCHGTPLFENCPFEVRCMRGISVKEMVDCFASWF